MINLEAFLLFIVFIQYIPLFNRQMQLGFYEEVDIQRKYYTVKNMITFLLDIIRKAIIVVFTIIKKYNCCRIDVLCCHTHFVFWLACYVREPKYRFSILSVTSNVDYFEHSYMFHNYILRHMYVYVTSFKRTYN